MSDLYEWNDDQLLSVINRVGHQELLIGYKDAQGECKLDMTMGNCLSYRQLSHANIRQTVLNCNCGCGSITIQELRMNVLLDTKDYGFVLHRKMDWAIAVYESEGFKTTPLKLKRDFRKRYPMSELRKYQRKQKSHLDLHGGLVL